jgi:hypothetical protein
MWSWPANSFDSGQSFEQNGLLGHSRKKEAPSWWKVTLGVQVGTPEMRIRRDVPMRLELKNLH